MSGAHGRLVGSSDFKSAIYLVKFNKNNTTTFSEKPKHNLLFYAQLSIIVHCCPHHRLPPICHLRFMGYFLIIHVLQAKYILIVQQSRMNSNDKLRMFILYSKAYHYRYSFQKQYINKYDPPPIDNDRIIIDCHIKSIDADSVGRQIWNI